MIAKIQSIVGLTAFVWASIGLAQSEETRDAPDLEMGEDEAIVYFLNPAGALNVLWAFVDDMPIGRMSRRTYAAGVVSAGEHVIWSRSMSVSSIRVVLEGGETYYFELRAPLLGVNIQPIDEEEAQATIENFSYAPLARRWLERANELISRHYDEALEEANLD